MQLNLGITAFMGTIPFKLLLNKSVINKTQMNYYAVDEYMSP
jgi:hypothetical protein